MLEGAALSFFRGSSQPRDQIQVSFITGRFFAIWATRGYFNPYISWRIKLEHRVVRRIADGHRSKQ